MTEDIDYGSTFLILIIAGLSYLIPKAGLIHNLILLKVLKLSSQWPKSAKFKELTSTPLLKLDKIKRSVNTIDLNEILSNIFDDFELAISGVNFEIKLIVQSIFENPNTFRLKDLDYIVISKMGTELLVIEFEENPLKKINSRSLFIEVTAYRSYCRNISIGISGVIFGLGMLGLANISKD